MRVSKRFFNEANIFICRSSATGVGNCVGSIVVICWSAGLVVICNKFSSACVVVIHILSRSFCVGGVVGLVLLNLPCHAFMSVSSDCRLLAFVLTR